MMRILVTAGNTQTPLDRVRCITNIFTGQTGTRIAIEANRRGHDVCLLTSHPELADPVTREANRWEVRAYRTFDELRKLMAETIPSGGFGAVIHCAAVSDYQLRGIYAPQGTALFDESTGQWDMPSTDEPHFMDVSAGKVKSSHEELWVRLVPTPKLIDRIRSEWEFLGVLVKFKLEVDVTDADLTQIADVARRQSAADLIVANTLDGHLDWAWMADRSGRTSRVVRMELAPQLIDRVEEMHRENTLLKQAVEKILSSEPLATESV